MPISASRRNRPAASPFNINSIGPGRMAQTASRAMRRLDREPLIRRVVDLRNLV